MKSWKTLFIVLAVFAATMTVSAQPAQIQLGYIPAGGHSVGAPCDTNTAVPFADATPVQIFWDNNANGPDDADTIPAVGTGYGQVNANGFTFNGTAQHYGAGYFYWLTTFRITQRPHSPDTALYYLRVNSGGTCWTTSDFYAPSGAQTIRFNWSQWLCNDHPCGVGDPPNAPANFAANGDTICMKIHCTWTHDSLHVMGFSIYESGNPTPIGSAAAAARSATISVSTDQPHWYYVRAFNEWGSSEQSDSVMASTYLIRFADGAAGNIVGQQLRNTNFTIHFQQPHSQCPASIQLYVVYQDTLPPYPWLRYGSGPVARDSLVMQITGHFPNVPLTYCRLLMIDSSWDRHVLFSDTTDSIFHLGIPSGVNPFANDLLPDRFGLAQNYPNPFNPETEVMFSVPIESQVRIRIYNVMGQLVRTLTDQHYSSGIHQIRWNGTSDNGVSVSAGVYFYRMEAQHFVQVKKMLMLK